MKVKYKIINIIALLSVIIFTFVGCGKSDNSKTKVDDTNKDTEQVEYKNNIKAGVGAENDIVGSVITTTTPVTTTVPVTTEQTPVTTEKVIRTINDYPTFKIGETFTRISPDSKFELYSMTINSIKETNIKLEDASFEPIQVFDIEYTFTNLNYTSPIEINASCFYVKDSLDENAFVRIVSQKK